MDKDTNLRISFVSGSYPPIKCGIGDYTARLGRTLARLGASVSAVSSEDAETRQEDGGPNIAAVVKKWNWRARPTIVEALGRQEPDVVNIQYPTRFYGRSAMINFLPFFIRRRLGVPVVFTVHEFDSFTWLGKFRIGLSAALSEQVIVPDRGNLALMARTFPWIQERVRHVPVGPNIEPVSDLTFNRHNWRLHFGAEDGTFVVSFFGFLSPSKGVEVLIGALEKLSAAARDLDWRLILVADRRPPDEQYAGYHRKIGKLLESTPVRDRVHWTGYCPEQDVSRYLQSSEICVLPFLDGATMRRTTLLSALTHELPVVSTYPAGQLDPELEPGKNIILTAPGNAAELASCIAQLAGDRGNRLRLSERARQFAANLSWEEIGRRTFDVCNAAITGKRG